jgi:lauroyl/myristoyl acyltransferase
METVGVSIFGRNARIHNGVFRLGAPFNAMLLPFYLSFKQGRFSAELFEPLPLADPDAPQRLARYIEAAVVDNYPDWLVSGHPSMYAFAPVR